MRLKWKTLLATTVATLMASLPLTQAGDAGVARISDSNSQSQTKSSEVRTASYQGCTDGGCAVAPGPMIDPGFSAAMPAASGFYDGGCSTGGCGTGGAGAFQSFGSATNARMSSLLGRGGGLGGLGGGLGSGRGLGGLGGGLGSGRGLGGLGGGLGGGIGNFWKGQVATYRARNARSSRALTRMFCPSGNCGAGAPPVGSYNMVYAADPNYFDQRDGSLYGAPGYGVPVTVPLAPNVHHQFNYGWGVPSSRITRISTPAGWSVQRPVHW